MSLKGKKGLIVGIANRNRIAYGCAAILRGRFLVIDRAAALTGSIEYVDAGYYIVG